MAGGYDVIVVGVGGMGSATCYELAKRGQKVLGLERYDIGHAMGSSHGETRMLRLAYFEGETYVPMVLRAHQLWRDIGAKLGEDLLSVTGTLDINAPALDIVDKAEAACKTYDLPYTLMDAKAIMERYPAFKLPSDYRGLFQPDGGFVRSEKAILGYTALAIDAGADIHPREQVLSFVPTATGGVSITTNARTYEAGRLILSPGAWISHFVPSLKPATTIYRQIFGWFRPLRPDLLARGNFPCFTLKGDVGNYYGFPIDGHPGFKLGGPQHGREVCDPELLIRESRPSDEKGLRDCLAAYLPDAMGPAMGVKVCLFTSTPDDDFIIDYMPGAPQIVVASPCSGHGFKFASVMGEILSDLAMDRPSPFDLSPFRISRFAGLA